MSIQKQSLRKNPSSLTTLRLIRYYEESKPLSHSGNILRFLQIQTRALTWKFNQDYEQQILTSKYLKVCLTVQSDCISE